MNGSKQTSSTEIVTTTGQLTEKQKLFNQLTKRIEKATKALESLKQLRTDHRSEAALQTAPLTSEIRSLNEKMVRFLDARLREPKGWSKKFVNEMADIAAMLADDASALGDISAPLAAAIERLKKGQNGADFSQLQDMLGSALGIDLGDTAKPQSVEEVMRNAFKKHQENLEQEETARQEKRAKRKKSQKQIVQEQEEIEAATALRTVYRQLASALHPDKEPDETLRAQKTLLMMQVNAANDAKDLLALLRLQLTVAQIDPEAISSMADDKLRQFTRLLQEQYKTVQDEVRSLEDQLRAEFEIEHGAVNAKTLRNTLFHLLFL